MEELLELRKQLEAHNYEAAIAIVNDLEEMSREDKINKIFSFSVLLLQHVIKQEAEGRTTSSWNASIKEASVQIKRINTRRKAGGTYLSDGELKDNLKQAFPVALSKATAEAFGGALSESELQLKITPQSIREQAFLLIKKA